MHSAFSITCLAWNHHRCEGQHVTYARGMTFRGRHTSWRGAQWLVGSCCRAWSGVEDGLHAAIAEGSPQSLVSDKKRVKFKKSWFCSAASSCCVAFDALLAFQLQDACFVCSISEWCRAVSPWRWLPPSSASRSTPTRCRRERREDESWWSRSLNNKTRRSVQTVANVVNITAGECMHLQYSKR